MAFLMIAHDLSCVPLVIPWLILQCFFSGFVLFLHLYDFICYHWDHMLYIKDAFTQTPPENQELIIEKIIEQGYQIFVDHLEQKPFIKASS